MKGKEGLSGDPAQADKQALVRAERRQKGGNYGDAAGAPGGLGVRQRPLAPAHAPLQTGVSPQPSDGA